MTFASCARLLLAFTVALAACSALKGAVDPPILQQGATACDLREINGSWWHGAECAPALGGGCCALGQVCDTDGIHCEAAGENEAKVRTLRRRNGGNE